MLLLDYPTRGPFVQLRLPVMVAELGPQQADSDSTTFIFKGRLELLCRCGPDSGRVRPTLYPPETASTRKTIRARASISIV